MQFGWKTLKIIMGQVFPENKWIFHLFTQTMGYGTAACLLPISHLFGYRLGGGRNSYSSQMVTFHHFWCHDSCANRRAVR